MSDEHIIPLSTAENVLSGQCLSMNVGGQPAHIDVVTGELYDAKGNPAGRWSPMTPNPEHMKILARMAHRQATGIAAGAIRETCLSANGREYVDELATQYWRDSKVHELEAKKNGAEKKDGQALDVGVADVHIESALPNFITGYANGAPVADIYSPPLVVQHKSDYYWQYAKEDAFQRAAPMLGAPASEPMEVFPRFGNTKFTTVMRAIATRIPTEVDANQDVSLRLKQAHTNRLIDASILEREFRVSGTARTSGNWGSATTILAGYNWNGGDNSDPVKDIHTVIEASYGNPNAMIVPEHIWNAMCRNPAVRAYYTYGGTSPGILTDQQMTAILKLPEIYISRMKYIKTDGTLGYVWGDDVVIFRRPTAMPPVNQREVCSSVTMRWGMTNVKVPDGEVFTPDMIDGRGWVLRQFFDPAAGQLGAIRMVLVLSDAEVQTSKYIGNLLINVKQ